jgi:hypothetical protein
MKFFKILPVILLFCTSLYTQNYYGDELIVGARGGAMLSTGSFTEQSGIAPKQNACDHLWGMTGGAVFRYSGEKYLGLQIEANFLQRGWAKRGGFSRTLNYVQIPLLSHVFFGTKNFRFFINAGPEISYLINEKNNSESTEPFVTENIKNRFDYGIVLGGGIELHSKAGIYQIEGRYEFGFGDVFSNTLSDTFRRSTNRNILMTFGILFNLKKHKK